MKTLVRTQSTISVPEAEILLSLNQRDKALLSVIVEGEPCEEGK